MTPSAILLPMAACTGVASFAGAAPPPSSQVDETDPFVRQDIAFPLTGAPGDPRALSFTAKSAEAATPDYGSGDTAAGSRTSQRSGSGSGRGEYLAINNRPELVRFRRDDYRNYHCLPTDVADLRSRPR